jgi:transposase InsO family protein
MTTIERLGKPHRALASATLADHGVLASVGSVGDAYDNALAESFVDSFKTELIADRVWRSRSQLELAVVEYIGWFNHDRLTNRSVTFRQPRWRPSTLPGSRPISLSK